MKKWINENYGVVCAIIMAIGVVLGIFMALQKVEPKMSNWTEDDGYLRVLYETGLYECQDWGGDFETIIMDIETLESERYQSYAPFDDRWLSNGMLFGYREYWEADEEIEDTARQTYRCRVPVETYHDRNDGEWKKFPSGELF